MLTIYRDHLVFFAKRLALAFFVFFSLFELLAEVALAITVHHGFAFIDAKFGCYFVFIDLVVGAQSEVDHALGYDRESQYYGKCFFQISAKLNNN